MKAIAIIPARYASSRLPGKVLADIGGQSMLFRVYQQAVKAGVFENIVVATDDNRIMEHCSSHDMTVMMTRGDHISGTDRIAEVARNYDSEIIVNIQGDEPFIEVKCIRKLTALLQKEEVEIGTLFKKVTNDSNLFDFNTVKIVKDLNDKILYFSRQAIPANRDLPYRNWSKENDFYQHIGLYGFRKKKLLEIVDLKPSKLELSEKLEQLRWLDNGYEVYGVEVESKSFGIDTEDDLKKARSAYK